MSDTVINPVPKMYSLRGQTVDQFGRDSTGLVHYQFNQQGFRSNQNFDFVPDWAFFGSSFVAGIGVPIEKTFASKFNNSQNYGVCGTYYNHDIREIIQQFLNSKLFSPCTKMAVFWTDRDCALLDAYYQELHHLDMRFFFCSKPLSYPRCYKLPGNLDSDVSGTHFGPKTHEFLYQTLCRM
jgi:hypothetical protein